MAIELLLGLSLSAFGLVLLGYRGANQWRILLILAAVGTFTGAVSLTNGRTAALPASVLAAVFLIWSALGRRRRWRSAYRPFSGFAALALGMLCALPLILLSAHISFPALEGRYAVGVREAEVSDPERGNDWNTTTGNPRQFYLRVWYPASATPPGASNDRNTEQERRLGGAFRGNGFSPTGLFGEALLNTTTHAYWDAPPAQGAFPLLLFSHGYAGVVYSNAMLMEQLASHGYVVVSLTHPTESTAVTLLSGQPVPQAKAVAEMFAEHAETQLFDAFSMAPAEKYDWAIEVFEPIRMVSERIPLWAGDFSSVLSALQSGRYTGHLETVLPLIDFSRVGFLGMSAGGAAAASACHTDQRCHATVALDGGIGVPALRNTQIRTPALIMDGGYPSRLGAQDLYYEPHATFGQAADVHRLVFPGNGHSDFTDLALALSAFGKHIVPAWLPVLGPTDGNATLLAQSRLTAAFFNDYLKRTAPFPGRLLESNRVATPVDPRLLQAWARSSQTR